MRRLDRSLAGIRYHEVPEGVTARPTPMGRALARYGAAVPVNVMHAINTVTREELADLRHREHKAEIERMAIGARRMREDRRALEIEMRSWRW